tara:strand:+ start:389 stop:1186 length:798 start_codon:yes stop_codon:yes gene_type:complete
LKKKLSKKNLRLIDAQNFKIMSKTVIIIPSRLSATRLPKKPLLKINNFSIIQHVYKRAKESGIGKVYVATGDKEIAEDIKKINGKYILTKKKHKTGTDRIYEAYTKIKKKLNCKYIINLQGDEPFIDPKDIINLNKSALKKKSDICTIASKINKNQFLDKSVVKVITDDNIVKKISKAKNFFRNCKISKYKNIYGHIGIYHYKASTLKQFVNLRQSNKEVKYRLEQLRAIDNGISIDVVYTKNRSLGIDTVEDYVEIKKIMEYKI